MSDSKPFINTIVKDGFEYGTGIWPFVNNKLSIRMNNYGEYETYIKKENETFTQLEIDALKEVNCLFSSINETDMARELFSKNNDINFDDRIGFFLNLYVGHVLEGSYRENASSGGFGTWIFTELLRLGHIDSVIHVKESHNTEKLFEYRVSRSTDEIIEGAKTKYYPVELSEVLKVIKNNYGKYAVIGVPSFIMELRLLSKHDSDIRNRIKFYIGLVCGHQKSTKFADLLAWQCGIKPGDLKSIDFRKKLDYGPSSAYAVEVCGLINGQVKTVTREMKNIYGGDWGKGLFKVKASDFSDDVMNETADLTLGDAWLPEYTKDNKGNNILVVRNPVINQIIQNAIDHKRVQLDSVNSDTIYRSQISHYRHSQEELEYRLYKRKKNKIWYPTKRFPPSDRLSFSRKRIQDIREKYQDKGPKLFIQAIEKDDYEFFSKRMRYYDLAYRFFYKMNSINMKINKIIKK
jgi:coenzyme F420 hydrogenase subunit beta